MKQVVLEEVELAALKKYERMKKVGATPHIVYRVMHQDHFWGLRCVVMLRSVFPSLSLGEIKEVMVEVDFGISADKYVEQMLPAIETVLTEEE